MLPQHMSTVELLAHAEPRRKPAAGRVADAMQRRIGGLDELDGADATVLVRDLGATARHERRGERGGRVAEMIARAGQ